jgi:hypothetical protein
MIKSQDNHVNCLTTSLLYKNAYTIYTGIQNGVAHKITPEVQLKFKFFIIFPRKDECEMIFDN